MQLVLRVILVIISHCLLDYGSKTSEVSDFDLRKPTIRDLRGDIDQSVANEYVESVIKKYDYYLLLKSKIEHYQTVLPNSMISVLPMFYFLIVVDGIIYTFPQINGFVAFLFGVLLTILIIIIDAQIINKFATRNTFGYTARQQLVDAYNSEHPTPSFPITEADAINNYILDLHFKFLASICDVERKRYKSKIVGLIVYGLLFVIFLITK